MIINHDEVIYTDEEWAEIEAHEAQFPDHPPVNNDKMLTASAQEMYGGDGSDDDPFDDDWRKYDHVDHEAGAAYWDEVAQQQSN